MDWWMVFGVGVGVGYLVGLVGELWRVWRRKRGERARMGRRFGNWENFLG